MEDVPGTWSPTYGARSSGGSNFQEKAGKPVWDKWIADNQSKFDAKGLFEFLMAEIEKESLDKTGLRSDVITLFGGARYHLYRYKKYTDVRLVWAPETAAHTGSSVRVCSDNSQPPATRQTVSASSKSGC